MHLLTAAGFLGSGKTTLLLRLGRHAASAGARVAFVVNEIGEIGVDDQLMRQLGMNVWELASGCICCSLAGELGPTLRMLEREFRPDAVFLEPSGAADPRGLSALLSGCGVAFESVRKVAVLDPLRIEALFAVLEPLITAQVAGADVVYISKIDSASAGELEQARRLAREVAPGARQVEAGEGDALPPGLLRELLPWLP